MNYVPQLQNYLEAEQKILSQLDLNAVSQLMNLMEEARQNHKRIFICGNGGSAATASSHARSSERRRQ